MEDQSIVKCENLQLLGPEKASLAKYDAMYRAITECHSVDEAKEIRDRAAAFAVYERQTKNVYLERLVTEIRLRAERRCGELLIEMAENGERKSRGGDGSNQHEQKSNDKTIALTLADLRITKQESMAWQQLAKMPQLEFDKVARSQKPVTALRLYFKPSKWKSFDWWQEYHARQEQDEEFAAFQTIKVHFAKLADMDAFSELIGQRIGKKTKSVWWPKVPIEARMDVVDVAPGNGGTSEDNSLIEIMDEGAASAA